MTLYIHEGCGHYIGSLVVCFAKTDEQAAQIVREYLDSHGLPKEPLNIRIANDYECGIVYAQDGDY
jgi:hypothetical protein